MYDSRRRGTTLIELMVATAFLGLGAIALLTCVNTMLNRETYAQRRAVILAAAQDQMDSVRSKASFGTISTGSGINTVTVSGLESNVTLTTTITLQSGYTDLYLVDVTASWNERATTSLTRADSLILDTYIRTNDT